MSANIAPTWVLALLAAASLALSACGKPPDETCEQVVDLMMAQKQRDDAKDVPEEMKLQLEALVREGRVKAIRECKENKDDLWTEEIRTCRIKADTLTESDACAAEARAEAAKANAAADSKK